MPHISKWEIRAVAAVSTLAFAICALTARLDPNFITTSLLFIGFLAYLIIITMLVRVRKIIAVHPDEDSLDLMNESSERE